LRGVDTRPPFRRRSGLSGTYGSGWAGRARGTRLGYRADQGHRMGQRRSVCLPFTFRTIHWPPAGPRCAGRRTG